MRNLSHQAVFFDERKTAVINLPLSNKNENFSKKIWKNGKVKFNTILTTKKLRVHSQVKTTLDNWNPSENDEKYFLFRRKSSLRSQDI